MIYGNDPLPGWDAEVRARCDARDPKLYRSTCPDIELNRFEELKYREIAEQLNISIKTVEKHMSKALRVLRTELADYLVFLILAIFQI